MGGIKQSFLSNAMITIIPDSLHSVYHPNPTVAVSQRWAANAIPVMISWFFTQDLGISALFPLKLMTPWPWTFPGLTQTSVQMPPD